ncbi:hypothetical protein KIL84_004901, partial [Mauremys mutica]
MVQTPPGNGRVLPPPPLLFPESVNPSQPHPSLQGHCPGQGRCCYYRCLPGQGALHLPPELCHWGGRESVPWSGPFLATAGRSVGLGSAPVISVEGHQDGGIRVVCRSAGWYPEPKAQWRDLQGQLLPSASEKISPEANGLFQTEIATVITEESNQKVSCCVRTPRLNQERESAISIA